LVGSVCAAAGLSLDNKRLAAELRARLAELQASRARLVQMADTERRRIERDLHDGAQQQLVILKSSLGLARWLVTSLPEAAGVLAQTEQQVAEALEQLRELAGRIYPPLLAELGAERRAGGLRTQGRRSWSPWRQQGSAGTRQQAEAAVYFCVLGALQNTAKYAQASAVHVTLCHDGAFLVFTVSDGRQRLRPAITPKETGLQGIADRLGALGLHHRHHRPPSRGIRLTGGYLPRSLTESPPNRAGCPGLRHPGGVVASAGQTIENPVTRERITFRHRPPFWHHSARVRAGIARSESGGGRTWPRSRVKTWGPAGCRG
jgi:glucose-6-phosphate-specific signal transduction histidine kinase